MLLLLALACRPEPLPPGVLLVTIDTWRADHLDATLTPNAVELAGRGARFTNAWSPIGLTTAAHASLLTGLLPPSHGLRGNNHHGYSLPETRVTLAEIYARAGWDTAAFVSAWPAGPAGNMAQGFDRFDAPDNGERPGNIAVDAAMAWLSERKKPWFLWVHVYEPHGPYVPNEADLAAVGGGEGDAARYRGEVHAADRIIGPLLQRAWSGGAIVALAGDHGEVLGEESCGYQHDRSAAPEVLRVPLLLAGPGIKPAQIDAQVGLIDLAPTLVRLTGMPLQEGLDGQDLLTAPPRSAWIGESGLCDPRCAAGCAPSGFLGKDRAVYAEGSSLILRPGRGVIGDSRLLPLLDAYPMPTEEPVGERVLDAVRSLGYIAP